MATRLPWRESARLRGQRAERRAERHLRRQGLKPLHRNYRCQLGEIDLIMRDGEVCVFVEVRFRRREQFGSPAESVDPQKQWKLQRTAQHFLQKQGIMDRMPCRFDLVCISGERPDAVQWIRDAF